MALSAPARRETLSDLLAQREDPMLAVEACSWLAPFRDIPDDAAPPLAMSPPHPRAVGSYGEDCLRWAREELGLTARYWQALAIMRQLEHDDTGALVYPEVIETGPRRIGKSVRLRTVALWRLAHANLVGETQLSMLVSKDLAVGKEIHRGSWRWAEQKGWKVTRLNGGQEIEDPATESRWLLRADTAVYGYDVGYGQVDESWGVDPQSITDGLEPALLERLWAQLHLTSTAHVKATSLMRRRLVAALKNADPNVLLLFWGAHPDDDVSDPKTWRKASPHWSQARLDLMGRKYAAALAGEDDPEFDDPDPVRGWAAQYLNVWPLLECNDVGAIPKWPTLAGRPGSPKALGIACDPQRRWLYLGGSDGESIRLVTPAAFSAGGPVVPMESLQDFLAEAVRVSNEIGASIALQEKGPAWHLRDLLTNLGATVVAVKFEELADGMALFDQRAAAGNIIHSDEVELNDAATCSTWKRVGNRSILAAKPGGNIGALDAALLALILAGRAPESVEPFALWG